MAEKLDVLVDGGKATPGAPLGPALGPLGVNIVEIIKAINEKTKAFEGMKVPVTLVVDPKTKAYTITVGTPPTSALITLIVVFTAILPARPRPGRAAGGPPAARRASRWRPSSR